VFHCKTSNCIASILGKLRRLNTIFERAADRSSRGIREDKLLNILPSGMAPKFKVLGHSKGPSQDPATNENHHPNRDGPLIMDEPVSSYRFISRGTFLAMFALESSAFINTTAQNEIIQRKLIQKKNKEKRKKERLQPLPIKNLNEEPLERSQHKPIRVRKKTNKKKDKEKRNKVIIKSEEQELSNVNKPKPEGVQPLIYVVPCDDSDDSSVISKHKKEKRRERREKKKKDETARIEKVKRELLEIERKKETAQDECQFLNSVATVLRNCFLPKVAVVGIAPPGDDGQERNDVKKSNNTRRTSNQRSMSPIIERRRRFETS